MEGVFRAQALAWPLPPPFEDALRVPRGQRAIIGEIGRRSPYFETGGPELDVGSVVKQFEDVGVSAIAVYTDDIVFGGDYGDVLEAAQVTSLPVIAKDFIIDPLQIVMARAHGASAVLLVATLLEERELRALVRQAWDLGLGVVVEAHSALELDALTKLRLGASESQSLRMMGVSSRDLRASSVDRGMHERIGSVIPEHVVRIAEGDFHQVADFERLEAAGYEAFFSDALLREPERYAATLAQQCGKAEHG